MYKMKYYLLVSLVLYYSWKVCGDYVVGGSFLHPHVFAWRPLMSVQGRILGFYAQATGKINITLEDAKPQLEVFAVTPFKVKYLSCFQANYAMNESKVQDLYIQLSRTNKNNVTSGIRLHIDLVKVKKWKVFRMLNGIKCTIIQC